MLPRGEFALIFMSLLVIAAGNTALQSVLPALGRVLALPDIAVALFFSLSAIVWTVSAPYWARRSDRQGRKRIILVGLLGFTIATLIGACVIFAGQAAWIAGVSLVIALALARGVFGLFGSATMPAAQAYVAGRTTRADRTRALTQLTSAFGLGTILGPGLAPFFVLPGVRLAGPLFVFAVVGAGVWCVVRARLPDDGVAAIGPAHGAAAAMPSIGGAPTGGAAITADAGRGPRLSWRDPRIRPWIVFGALSANAQAAASQTLGFLVIDRLGLPPEEAQKFIGIALMSGAASALLAQWGLIANFDLKPRDLLRWGAMLAALGLMLLSLAPDYYAIIVAFGLAGVGFGFTRPGFAAGASLSVRPDEQGAVAGAITAVNGGAFIVAPASGILLYQVDEHLPFVAATAIMVALAIWAARDPRLGGGLDARAPAP